MYSNKNIGILYETLNNELKKVSKWLIANKLPVISMISHNEKFDANFAREYANYTINKCFPFTIALHTRYKLTRVRPGLKLTRISFCRVNTANPGSTRVKSNLPPEGRTRVRLEKCRVNTNLGRTRVSFDFAHAHSWVLWSYLTRTATRIYKTIDLITEYNNFTCECNQLACV